MHSNFLGPKGPLAQVVMCTSKYKIAKLGLVEYALVVHLGHYGFQNKCWSFTWMSPLVNQSSQSWIFEVWKLQFVTKQWICFNKLLELNKHDSPCGFSIPILGQLFILPTNWSSHLITRLKKVIYSYPSKEKGFIFIDKLYEGNTWNSLVLTAE